jgi:coenzyme F420-reducing hydrogenase gamma subunit
MKRPRIGVFKFASCDGCQLSLLNLEEELLKIVDLFRVDYFCEVIDRPLRGDFDIAIVEGSISTPRQREEILEVRERTRYLLTIGACATSGGLQAIRNRASLSSFKTYVYPDPAAIDVLSSSTPISDHTHVDYELWGCPIDSGALSEVLASYIIGKRPGLPQYSLCMDCKNKGIPCILVSKDEPCLGPVTRTGCGVLCPSFGRACYGCFGPRDEANIESLLRWFKGRGLSIKDCAELLDRMNTYTYQRGKIEKKD